MTDETHHDDDGHDHGAPEVIGQTLTEPISKAEADELAAANPDAIMVLLPAPEALATDDPAELAFLLAEAAASLRAALERSAAIDQEAGDWLPDGEASTFTRAGGYLEDALLKLYSEFPEVIARLLITHLMRGVVNDERNRNVRSR